MAIIKNIYINQGTNFCETFDLVDSNNLPLDLSAYNIVAIKGRLAKHSLSTTYTDLNAVILDDVNGKVGIALSPTQSSPIRAGKYIYEIVLINNTNCVNKIVEGSAIVDGGVSVESYQYSR